VSSCLSALGLPERLGKKLVELAREHGQPVAEGIQIELALTQEELAAMVGGTRATVNQLLGAFEDRGAITRRNRRIVVLQPELLYAGE